MSRLLHRKTHYHPLRQTWTRAQLPKSTSISKLIPTLILTPILSASDVSCDPILHGYGRMLLNCCPEQFPNRFFRLPKLAMFRVVVLTGVCTKPKDVGHNSMEFPYKSTWNMRHSEGITDWFFFEKAPKLSCAKSSDSGSALKLLKVSHYRHRREYPDHDMRASGITNRGFRTLEKKSATITLIGKLYHYLVATTLLRSVFRPLGKQLQPATLCISLF